MCVCWLNALCFVCVCVCTAGSAGQGISSNHETYLISADSAELADSWVTAIRAVMHEVCRIK